MLTFILNCILKRPRFHQWRLWKRPKSYCTEYYHPSLKLRIRGYGATPDASFSECSRTFNKVLDIYRKMGVLN